MFGLPLERQLHAPIVCQGIIRVRLCAATERGPALTVNSSHVTGRIARAMRNARWERRVEHDDLFRREPDLCGCRIRL